MDGDTLLLPLRASSSVSGGHLMPALFANAPTEAQRAFLEFFAVTIPNANTRTAYMRDVARFAQWCDERSFRLEQITSIHLAAYREEVSRELSNSSQGNMGIDLV